MSTDASREAFEAWWESYADVESDKSSASDAWRASRKQALADAAQVPREHAMKLADGPFGLRFPDEATAICNASTAMGEKIKGLI